MQRVLVGPDALDTTVDFSVGGPGAAPDPFRGGEVLEPAKAVATGRNLLARHPDGTLVEYVEHSA